MDDYLERLEFKNFQSLQSTSIDLSPHFNVVVGPSNLGKSAALRAIKALMRNAPAPGLLREGAKQFDLIGCFSNGNAVQLSKGKNKSVFVVNGDEYAKSGVKAPEAVTELWAMAAPDGRELGFATQHETPFLLAEPASAVAKVLGDLTNAAVLMEAVGKANRMRTEALNDVKAREREAEEARTELLSHAGLKTRAAKLEAAREAYRAADEATQKLAEVDALITRHDLLVEDLEQLSLVVGQSLELDDQFVELNKLIEMFVEVRALIDEHDAHVFHAKRSADEAGVLTQEFEALENEVHEVLEQAGVCPLCGSGIK